jgi:hypothetical protein
MTWEKRPSQANVPLAALSPKCLSRRPSARARSPKLLVSAVELDLAMEKNMLRRNGSRSQEREGSAAAGVVIIGILKRG